MWIIYIICIYIWRVAVLKKIVLTMLLLGFVLGSVLAQSFGSVAHDKAEAETIVDDDRGFSAQAKVETNLFQLSVTQFSDAKERYRRTDSLVTDNYPFGGFNIFNDTNVAFGYNSSWFGGKFSLGSGGMGGIKAWVGFFDNKLKISAGTDVGYGYADSQGADAGLRVYDDHTRNMQEGINYAEFDVVDSNKNPDNITQDKGILFEIELEPVKIAFAGGGNMKDIGKNMGSFMSASNNDPIYGHSMQYGLNIGSRLGPFAKINGAYIFQSNRDETRFEYNAKADRIVALRPDAEVSDHLFGVYASYYPLGNDALGFTLAYAGVYTRYLEEFSVDSRTAIPSVFKNGLNLTARYRADRLTIKTDHNFSFWSDKNYRIYNFYKPEIQRMKDYGLLAASNDASDVSDVSHSFLWNGLGASYRLTRALEGSIYARNLIRADETPEYKMIINYFSLELKTIFFLASSVEAYAGITYRYTGRSVSESLPKDVSEFGANAPRATSDSVNMIQIPIGLTVKLHN